ncbi:MAG: hypothetical protein GY940_41330, partial [bacterium]|nr:hypothetical protein [bacterium]
PPYMVPSYFSRLERIPLTANGKVDRTLLPTPRITTGEGFVSPRNTVEEKLAEVWSGVLPLEKEQIGIDGNFFRLGGHSLKATVMLSRIHKTFNVNVPLTSIFTTPTIRGLAACIKKTAPGRYISIEPAEKKEYYPLSSAQGRLYLLYRMDMDSTGYNMPSISILEGEIHKDQLENAFLKLLHRHESLRTSFQMVAEEPVQRVHDKVEFEITYYDSVSKTGEETRIKAFILPFDLSRPPLLRVGLIKEEDTRHIFLVDMHHIISDGTSMSLLVKDFTDLYSAGNLPELKIQYKDFSGWQNSEKETKKHREQYWLNEFKGDLPVLVLAADFPRPEVLGFGGASERF